MPSYFRTSRNVELSLTYYLSDRLSVDWAGTTVVKAFKNVYTKDIALPIVCVHLADTSSYRREIGATTLEDRYLLIIDIFAEDDGQRLDMADYIKSKLEIGWVHFTFGHASGDKSTMSRSVDGKDFVTEFISDGRVDAPFDVDVKDRYRHRISIRVRHSNP